MAGKTKREVYSLLAPLVYDGRMVFSENVNGRRVPKPMEAQIQELKNSIGRIYSYLGRSKGSRFEDEEISSEDMESSEDQSSDESSEEEISDEDEEDEDEQEKRKPEAKGKKTLRDEWKKFVSEVHRIRRFCIDRERLSGEHVDWISMRPMQAASRLIAAGIPANVLLLSMTMHWSPDTRQDAGIDSFDFATDGAFTVHPGMLEVSERVMREREIPQDGKHVLFGYLLLLVENRVPFFLIGPAGTGKSHIAKQVADYLGIDYGETSMAAGSSRSDLLGRHTINQEKPFIPAEHTQQFSAGGLHLFDEIDRADPSTMVPLHNALASDEMYNSINGERYAKSDHYSPGAAGNTFGLGANRQYTSAERLDAATLDRFRMGRIYLPIDEKMEEETFTAEFQANLH
jgi:hypothetical protein